MAIYNEYAYPLDFNSEQRDMLDEAAAVYDLTDGDEYTEVVDAIRNDDFLYVRGARNAYDIGYAQRDIVGVDEFLESFFDWEGFGEFVADEYERGGFGRFGWLGLAHK